MLGGAGVLKRLVPAFPGLQLFDYKGVFQEPSMIVMGFFKSSAKAYYKGALQEPSMIVMGFFLSHVKAYYKGVLQEPL